MALFGWTGKGLEVDLTNSEWKRTTLSEEACRHFLGGRGLAVNLISEEMDPQADPLAAEASLVFAAGPLTGTRTPTSGRHAVAAKSPLTGTIFDANSGGRFGTELKRAGLDYILLRGRAPSPVVLTIRDEEIEIEPAEDLWGLNCTDTLAKMNNFASACCIGRAAENGALLAGIMNDGHSLAGRGGLGAVMANKNLKAIAISGSGKPRIANIERFDGALEEINRLIVASPVASKGLSNYGTPALVNLINYMRIMPTANFRDSFFKQAEDLSGETIADTYARYRAPCHACPIGCKHSEKGSRLPLPEYETIAMLGPDCSNPSLETVVEANRLCNDYGLDTISVGATLACYSEEEGRTLSKEEILSLIRQIGEGEGLGAELGKGSLQFSGRHNRDDLSMSVKGLELPGYDPRGALGMALGYATSNRGGCHLRAYMIGPEIFGKPKLIDRLSWSGKAGLVAIFQNFFAAVDSLVVCKFLTFSVGEEELADALSAATGIAFSTEDLLKVGERIWNAERLFNLGAGLDSEDDTLPQRFFSESTEAGLKPLQKDEFANALRQYYACRGWDEEGQPSTEKLTELGLTRG
ncbi:MAG: aldehyde ferredoxin oxidoreductase [Armatimonadetes bacterium]|nr:aldehyde ferredoxin oxidoreductase [Armatimonadota bacterium]NIO74731.1 aldehyde ferredoxin oxidoreductase [Armatimonadota bacterium]NIO97606.1 aldehyde ferredoxin oxidoreductase [Armatimonadota bacterium]